MSSTTIKAAAKRIPEEKYERFKNRLIEKSNKWEERNITLFLLGIATGYRLQDLVDLTIADIKEALNNECFVIQEKKQYKAWETYIEKNPGKYRKAPEPRSHDIIPKLENILRKYIKGKKASEYAFPSQKGNGSSHITAKAYSDILKNVAEDKTIKLKHITGHSLRKTYSRRLYESSGHDLEYVRIALGHSSVEITKKYLDLNEDVKRSAAKIAGDKL